MTNLENIVDEETCKKPVSFWERTKDFFSWLGRTEFSLIKTEYDPKEKNEFELTEDPIKFGLAFISEWRNGTYQVAIFNSTHKNYGTQLGLIKNNVDIELGLQIGSVNKCMGIPNSGVVRVGIYEIYDLLGIEESSGKITQIGIYNTNLRSGKSRSIQVGLFNSAESDSVAQYGLLNLNVDEFYLFMNPKAREKLVDDIKFALTTLKDDILSLFGYDSNMIVMEIAENDTYICKICGEEDSVKNSVQCLDCNTRYHFDCGEYAGKCPTMGCGATNISEDKNDW